MTSSGRERRNLPRCDGLTPTTVLWLKGRGIGGAAASPPGFVLQRC